MSVRGYEPIFVCFFVNAVFCGPSVEQKFENGTKKVVPPLSLETLFAELRQESKIMAEAHLGSMLLVASYGDQFYNLQEEVSNECQRTLAATVSMTTNLCTFEKVDDIMDAVMADSYEDILYTHELKHPLQFLCNRIEQRFLYTSTNDPPLYAEFTRLKEAMKNRTLTRRKPYLIKISRSEKELGAFYLHMMKIPQMAKYLAHEGFEDQLYPSEAYNRTFYILAKSILTVARKDTFKDRVQELYDQTLSEVADFISRTQYEKLRVLNDNKTYWFTEIIMTKLKKCFDENPSLKVELEKTVEEMEKL